jgi:predicted metalloprotease with PDZ domain
MLDLQWQAVLLYPDGYAAKAITVEPTVRLPNGWSHAAALEPAASPSAGVAAFRPVTLETLIDSPLFAGRHFKAYDLDPGSRTPVRLNVFGESAERVEATSTQVEAHRELVRQADKLFGGVRRFNRYDFLLGATSQLTGIGLEHLRSSENITTPDYFTDWAKTAPRRTLLPHEYTHSWNGKHTRPRGLEQVDYNTPVDAGLLWIYEGLTDYWGTVLAARSGLSAPSRLATAWRPRRRHSPRGLGDPGAPWRTPP